MKRELENLNMGYVNTYTMLISLDKIKHWEEKGWVLCPTFTQFHYGSTDCSVVMISKPDTILDRKRNYLIGRKIEGYNPYYGSYGMGGPGFFGLELEMVDDEEPEVLVFAVWLSTQFIYVDGILMQCHPDDRGKVEHWFENPKKKKQFEKVIVNSLIKTVEIEAGKVTIDIEKDKTIHKIEFVMDEQAHSWQRYFERQKEEDRDIGHSVLFQNRKGMLWV